MSRHIEETVAGQRYCFARSAVPVLSRLLVVSWYAFRVGPDAAARAPSPLCI